MLESIRKFSSTIPAKILMGIIIIPFVLWGMGDVFRTGTKNTITTINKEKISAEEFVNYINSLNTDLNDTTIKNQNFFEKNLSNFIGKKLVELEMKYLGINISEKSLANIIKNQSIFKKDNKFSRTKYEKFLISSNLTALTFEKNFKNQEERKMFFDLIGGGVSSPKFLVNNIYNNENQVRKIKLIDLKNKINEKKFNNEERNKYFEENKEFFKENYRSIKFAIINPKTLIGEDEYNDLFFKKIDEIDDKIADLDTIESIASNFNLKLNSTDLFNVRGESISGKEVTKLDKKLFKKIFELNENRDLTLLQGQKDYFLIKLEKAETTTLNPENDKIKNQILKILKLNFIIDGINKINERKINKNDFLEYAKKNNLEIKIVNINNINDDSNLSKMLVQKIYKLPKNSIKAISNSDLTSGYIVSIENISNKTIEKTDKNYEKYFLKSNLYLTSNIYKTYDQYLSNKYKVKINYQTLDRVKNYFK